MLKETSRRKIVLWVALSSKSEKLIFLINVKVELCSPCNTIQYYIQIKTLKIKLNENNLKIIIIITQ